MMRVYFGGAKDAVSKEGTSYKTITLIVPREGGSDSFDFYVDVELYAKCQGKTMFDPMDVEFCPGYKNKCAIKEISFVNSTSSKTKASATAEDFK